MSYNSEIAITAIQTTHIRKHSLYKILFILVEERCSSHTFHIHPNVAYIIN